MITAFVFPGQGSQTVGMGKELADAFSPAREVFQEVDDALSQNLSTLMFEGPEADLTLTENAQPALMAVSMAVMRVLESECGLDLKKSVRAVSGHSLGEYSALAAVGAFTLGDAARLLKKRGQAMQQAVPVGEGAMAALLGLDLDVVGKIAQEASAVGVCAVANDNSPGQVVVSGARAAIDRALELATEKGAKRSLLLPVSAPFHCPLMQPAADAMAEALASTTIAEPAVPVFANVTAAPTSDPEEIRDLLVKQVTGTVRWRECVEAMRASEIERFIEIGAGRVLAGLVKRIDRSATNMSVGTPADIEALDTASL